MSRLLSTLTETLAGTRAVTSREFQDYGILAFDPGGAGRTVTLPTLSADLKHHRVRIYNRADAAETLTVTATHPVAGAVTVATVDQNEAAEIFCPGGAATTDPGYYAVVYKIGIT